MERASGPRGSFLSDLYWFFWVCLTAIPGMWDQLFHRASKFSLTSLEKQVIIVTGGNKGIGLETVRALAEKGAHVIIACRDVAAGNTAAAELRITTHNQNIEVAALDLSSLESVRKFVEAFKRRNLPLHVLVNNAGLMFGPYKKTVDGLELQLATNHFGHYLLTLLLLPKLEETSGRIVVVSSAAHAYGTINFGDLQSSKYYSPHAAYMQSKLANLLFTYELNRRLRANNSTVTVNAVHPGVVKTDLWRHSGALMSFLSLPILLLYKNAKGGAETLIYLAASPKVARVSGKYFAECREIKSSSASYNADAQKRLWKVTAETTSVDYP